MTPPAATPKFEMTVDLAVLESLGINLYSNAAAVLSELVANAYDADANDISISWKEEEDSIVVADDGCGMTVPQINARFLTAGYKKRETEGTKSPKFKRPFMGRKGIGKLSVFSIARVVKVFSSPNASEHNGLQINLDALEECIRARKKYHPAEIPVPTEYQTQGTTLVLSDLKSKRADLTANALRKRLARRFDVTSNITPAQGGFRINVNGTPITFADRQELKRLEFIWEFGGSNLPASTLPDTISRYVLPADVNTSEGWKVSGWIGTARRPTDLTDDSEAGSLKNIIVLARKRPIQEGIIEKLDFSRIFGSYVTGQIEADFLDLDGDYEDIATSDRQRLIEDDARVVALQAFLRDAFVKAAETWSKERPKKEAKDVLKKYPRLKEWVEARPPYQRDAAKVMIGTIAGLSLEKGSETSRTDLLRSGVLAFERVGLRQVSTELEALSDIGAEQLLQLLGAQEVYEEAMWVDILRSRVDAISQFKSLKNADEKEKVLQKHLFKHLWLLDAAWERAVMSETMEENLRKIEPGVFPVDDAGKEIFGRMDIRYASTAGKHVIVELKRYSVKTDVAKLTDQGLKYYAALQSVLSQQNDPEAQIEIVFVIGDHPPTSGRGRFSPKEYIENSFDRINAHYVLYDQLIANANKQYEEYLNASAKARELDELLETISDVADSEESGG